MEQPRFWKKLDRHPISARYPDLEGDDFAGLVQGVKDHGVINDRKIYLYESQVVDGWQLYRACIEAEVKPKFAKPKLAGMDIEEWIELVQERRRHESAATVAKRIKERRERIFQKREEGESLRAIAAAEKVSTKTVQKDLEASGVDGSTPGTVAGLDGKKHPSTKDAIRCERCIRVGKNDPKCEACIEARKNAKPSRRKPSRNGQIVFDDKPIPKLFGQLLRTFDARAKKYPESKGFREVEAAMDKVAAAWDRWRFETTGKTK